MQNSRQTLRNSSIILILLLFLVVLLSLNLPAAPVYAQNAEPSATPNDPIWLAFVAARAAIEEEREVDLTIVRNWEFYQDNWEQPHPQRGDNAAGLDSCNSTVHIVNARSIYYGWTFSITDLRGDVYEARVSFDLEAVVVCDLLSTPVVEEAPAPEATDEAGEPISGDLPAPVAGSGATGGFELGGQVSGLTPDAIDRLRASGMVWVKQQLPLAAGIGEAQNYIDSVHANGFKILLSVVGDAHALGADFDGYAATYSAFVAQVATLGADAIEVWNEANLNREWPEGMINGGTYTQLLAAAFNAIKGANPNTMVVSGAPAPTGYWGAAGCGNDGCNDDTFMQQMADAGAASYLDCVGLHYNEGIVSPATMSGDPRGEYPTYYFSSMLNRGYAPFGGKPVCFTEMGYLTPEGMGGPLPGAFGWAGNTTVAQQAAWLSDAVARAAQSGRVRMVIVFNINFTLYGGSDPQGGYAIVRPDGSCPACSALATVMGG